MPRVAGGQDVPVVVHRRTARTADAPAQLQTAAPVAEGQDVEVRRTPPPEPTTSFPPVSLKPL